MTRWSEAPRSPTLADQGQASHAAGGPILLPRRGRVAGSGFVERVTILPRSVAPQFSATLALHGRSETYVRLVWTGQRRIAGIEPGVDLAFEGMVSEVDGTATIHNPRYEIVGRPEESP